MEIPAGINPKNLSSMPQIDWNSAIKHQANLRNDGAILTTYFKMQSLGVFPNANTLPLVFKACGNLNAVDTGREIHANLSNSNLLKDVRVGTSLVDFYCKCGCLWDARYVFDEMLERDVVTWNAMIAGFVELLEYEEALNCFTDMVEKGFRPNSRTLVSALIAAGELMEEGLGKALHSYCLRNLLLESNAHLVTALIGFYSKFNLILAERVFKSVELRSVVVWNAMINAYFDAGEPFKALGLFIHMLMKGSSFDLVTLLVVIQACGEYKYRYGCCELVQQLHQLAIKCGFDKDLRVVDALINAYSGVGFHDFSCTLFSSVSGKDVTLWNSMLSVYIENGKVDGAIDFFRKARLQGFKNDERTICIMLSLCKSLANGLRDSQSLHAYTIKHGMEDHEMVRSTLLSTFSEVNCVESAVRIFDKMAFPDVSSRNTVILALARNGVRSQALDFFLRMGCFSNSHSIISILAACDNESYLNLGSSIHGYAIKLGIEVDPPLHTALTEMYMNCNNELESKLLFKNFPNKDLISWNAMIAAYTNNNEPQKALLLFRELVYQIKPSPVTILNALSACMDLANLPASKCIHAYAVRRLFLSDLPVANALITTYAKCGNPTYAENAFTNLSKLNLVSWNAMISCYGVHGRGQDALLAYSKLLKSGFVPDKITFVSILAACSHSGMIETGLQLYHSMIRDFKIIPEDVHYACVIDLLARGSRFVEAQEFINSMPIPPIASAWRALLGACRVYSETKYASTIFEKLVELEPTNPGNFVLLSNIFAAAGKWSEVEKLRKTMREKGLKKPVGRSWIVIRNEIHYFSVGDKSHGESHKIYEKLEELLGLIREVGYVPDISWVLHDEENEKRVERLSRHSEKLAIAYGLIRVGSGAPVLIGKNLRICGDCHEFGKFVSRVTRREIVVRDGVRFHHFSNGACSCKDYW